MEKNIAFGSLSIISMIGAVSAAESNHADTYEPPIRWRVEKAQCT